MKKPFTFSARLICACSMLFLCSYSYAHAQTISNRQRLLSGMLGGVLQYKAPSVIATPVSLVKPFGGYVLYKMQNVICPGYGPWMIRPVNGAPTGPYYLSSTQVAGIHDRLDATMKKLQETRDAIDRAVGRGEEPRQLLLDEERSQVKDMQTLRNQIETTHSSSPIEPYRWILGNYNIVSAPCATNTVPPVPVPAFSISTYGISPPARVIN